MKWKAAWFLLNIFCGTTAMFVTDIVTGKIHL